MNVLNIIVGVLSMAKAALEVVIPAEQGNPELVAILNAVDKALAAAISDLTPHAETSKLGALPPAAVTALLGALQVAKTAVEIAAAVEFANPLVSGILRAVDAALMAAISALQPHAPAPTPLPSAVAA